MRNPLYEQALTNAGLEFEYCEKVSDDSINKTRGKQLQARLVPLDDELIEQYKEMFNDGLEPPPLILWRHGKSKLIPLDGNQRLAANERAKKKLKNWCAYIVDCDDPMVIDRLCWQWNNLVNGRRLSYEEAMEHAITFVRKYNQSVNKTAKDWGVKLWELEKRCRILQIREVGAKKGVDSSKVPDTTINHLGAFTKFGDDVVAKVLKVCAESGIGEKPVQELGADVNRAKSLDAKIALIDDFATSEKVAIAKAQTKGGKVVQKINRMPSKLLLKELERMESLLDEFELVAFKQSNKSDRERAAGSSLFICNKLIQIHGLGPLLKGQSVAQ